MYVSLGLLPSFPDVMTIFYEKPMFFFLQFRVVYKIVETSQAPVPENTDDNPSRHHFEPTIQQEINNIGKFSTTSEKFGSSVNKLPVGQKYHLIKSHFVPPINYKFPTRFLHQCRRGFQSRYLDEYSWMVYSPSVDGVFCKHCALLITIRCRKDKDAFVNNPFILT